MDNRKKKNYFCELKIIILKYFFILYIYICIKLYLLPNNIFLKSSLLNAVLSPLDVEEAVCKDFFCNTLGVKDNFVRA